MELSYINNPQSLFRKYSPLVTSLTKHQLFRDYLGIDEEVSLLLPNGYRRQSDDAVQTTIYSKAVFAPKLYPYLKAFDTYKELRQGNPQKVLAEAIGLIGKAPLGLTITTSNPDANPESTTVDGHVRRQGVNETIGTIRNGAGTHVADSSSEDFCAGLRGSTTTNQFQQMDRGIFLFDTSAIPEDEDITTAVFSVDSHSILSAMGHVDIEIVTSNPTSNTTLATGDYAIAKFGSTALATPVNTASITIDQYTDWTLNESGIAAIATAGITKLGTRTAWDLDNSFGGSWSSGGFTIMGCSYADEGVNPPKLVVTSVLPATGGTNPMFFSTGGNTLG